MMQMRWMAAGALALGLGITGYGVYGYYSDLDLAEIGVSTTIVQRTRGKNSGAYVDYNGRHRCNGGVYDKGTPVVIDPNAPWRCRSMDDLGGFSINNALGLTIGAALVLLALVMVVFERFAADDSLERLT